MSVCVHYGLVATEQIREYLSKLCLSLNTTSARACNAELRQNENRNAIRSSRIRERIENKQIANETTQMHGKNQCLRRAIASNAFFIDMFECCFPFKYVYYIYASLQSGRFKWLRAQLGKNGDCACATWRLSNVARTIESSRYYKCDDESSERARARQHSKPFE